MGKIIFKTGSLFNTELILDFQKEVIDNISSLFRDIELDNINVDYELGAGLHGNYESTDTYLIKINISIVGFTINFAIDYDQLEYYISTSEKIVKQCILESYFDEKVMIDTFITYFKIDLKKLKIPFNEF